MWSIIWYLFQFDRECHQQQRSQGAEPSPVGQPHINISQVRFIFCSSSPQRRIPKLEIEKNLFFLTDSSTEKSLLWQPSEVCGIFVPEIFIILTVAPPKLCFTTKYLLFSLRSNNIGSKGAKYLAEALKMNQALVSLK